MIRTLRTARRSAVKSRTQAANQLRNLVVTAPDGLHHRLRRLSTWRNLRGDAPVIVYVRGRKLKGTATAITGDGELVARELQTFPRRFPGTVGRYRVTVDAEGRPDPREVAVAARREDTVMIRMRVE